MTKKFHCAIYIYFFFILTDGKLDMEKDSFSYKVASVIHADVTTYFITFY